MISIVLFKKFILNVSQRNMPRRITKFRVFEKLKIAVSIVTEKIIDDSATKHINEAILNKIIISSR